MPISSELDELSCTLMGEVLDRLADGVRVGAVASLTDERGMRLTCDFEQDSPEQCLEAARSWVRAGGVPRGETGSRHERGEESGTIYEMGEARCYAIAYEGAVEDPDEPSSASFRDALLVEFGERGEPVSYSAYVLVEGVGEGDRLRYTDPAPAGEMTCLL